MATYDTYYLNAENFESATCVFTNSTLSTVAPAGWYSNDVTTRYLTVVAGVGTLGLPLDCPSCFLPCDEEIANTGVIAAAPANYQGTYTMDAEVGTGIGAIIVRVRLNSELAAGLLVKFGTSYTSRSNKFTASDFQGSGSIPAEGFPYEGGANGGYRGNINNTILTAIDKPLWIGKTSAGSCQNPSGGCAPAVPQLPDNTPFTGVGAGPVSYNEPTYVWSPNPNQFTVGPNANIDVETQQVQLGAGSEDWVMCVIPKTSQGPTTINVQYQYYCCNGGAAGCNGDALINVECPVQLTGFNTSYVQPSQQAAIESEIVNSPQEIIYNAPGASGCIGGLPAQQFLYGVPNKYDFAFIDPNGETYAASGWYKYLDPNGDAKLFFVDSYGVITSTNVTYIPASPPCSDIINIENGTRGVYEVTTQCVDGGGTPAAGVQIVRFRSNGPAIGAKVERIEINSVAATATAISSTGQQYDTSVELSQTSFEQNDILSTTNGGGYVGDNSGGEIFQEDQARPCYFGHVDDEAVYPFVCGGENISLGGGGNCGYSNNGEFVGFQEDCSEDGNGCGDDNCFGTIFLPPNGVHNLDGVNEVYVPPSNTQSQSFFPWTAWNFTGGSSEYPTFTYTQGEGFNQTNTSIVQVNTNQVQISNATVSNGVNEIAAKPGWAMIVLPVPLADPEIFSKTIITSLACNTNFNLFIECVSTMASLATVPLYGGSVVNYTQTQIDNYCAGVLAGPFTTIYFAHGAFGGEPVGDSLAGTGNCGRPCIPGAGNCGNICASTATMPTNIPYAYDMAFTDQYAQNKAQCGVYMFVNPNTGNNSFFAVDNYGVIVCVKECVPGSQILCPGLDMFNLCG